ncbi:MAG: hypothetical protein DSM107014_16395 [Gomphosphaeria aponina SAG 52.96 = DSM 107014]|uniref:Uncharacterized protein n=1 Tax=Gomphosphaeria aponina SAG 52.96 = DSM 107014 TaxID=1521640 RepID=A0A941JVN2_9CHRO|nr:hypothetical protein [Gomphosphaeria aponina SAG 52.96 = DSM 107014]
MLINKHLNIKTFYKEELKQFFIESDFNQGIHLFKPDCLIGEAQIPVEEGVFLNGSINNTQGVPESVLSAFARHLWYAGHSISNIAVLKVLVNNLITFAICIHGYVDDGWDNGGDFIEIYDEKGKLVGSVIIPSFDDADAWENWEWMNRPILGDDFNTPAPEPKF